MAVTTAREKVALVTGANKGIGLEIARGLGRQGVTLLIGARDPARGEEAVTRLRTEGIIAHPIVLDVADAGSIGRAAEATRVGVGRLDILINNAGVMLDWGPAPSSLSMDVVRQTFDTNVFGPVTMIQSFLPLLRQAPAGRVVNMSSGLGSLTWTSDARHPYAGFGLLAYNASKAALNMVTVQFANELRATAIKVNAADPGYCATDLNNHTGPRSPKQGAVIALRLATLPDDGPTGGFFNDEGRVPW